MRITRPGNLGTKKRRSKAEREGKGIHVWKCGLPLAVNRRALQAVRMTGEPKSQFIARAIVERIDRLLGPHEIPEPATETATTPQKPRRP